MPRAASTGWPRWHRGARRSLRGGPAGGSAEEAVAYGPKAKAAGSRRKAANDEDHEAPRKRAAATKTGARAATTVKPKPRKKAA